MADMPQDPRQLARDLLSGKISIEELARRQQQQRQGGAGGGGGGGGPSRVPPAQSPSVRTVEGVGNSGLQTTSTGAQRSNQQQTRSSLPDKIPMPKTQAQRAAPPPIAPPRQRPPIQTRQPQQSRPPQKLTVEAPAASRAQPLADIHEPYRTAPAKLGQTASEVQATAAAIAAGKINANRARKLLRNKASVRAGFVLSELLGPPAALREERY